MAQNINPIFPLTPRVTWVIVNTANTATDGTGTVYTVFTAQASGSRIDYLSCSATGSNVASVLRVFLNNGNTNATATNNALYTELALPSTTATNTAATGPQLTIPINISLPSGSKVNLTLGTAVASGWAVTAVGGDY